MVIDASSVPTGIPNLGCSEEGNFIQHTAALLSSLLGCLRCTGLLHCALGKHLWYLAQSEKQSSVERESVLS